MMLKFTCKHVVLELSGCYLQFVSTSAYQNHAVLLIYDALQCNEVTPTNCLNIPVICIALQFVLDADCIPTGLHFTILIVFFDQLKDKAWKRAL